jgi:hypothetical protein
VPDVEGAHPCRPEGAWMVSCLANIPVRFGWREVLSTGLGSPAPRQAGCLPLHVASGILPDVEGAHPCRPEQAWMVSCLVKIPMRFGWREVLSTGLGSPAPRQAGCLPLHVASGILPDVEGAHPCRPERAWMVSCLANIPVRRGWREVLSTGLEARLHGRQDACRYGAHAKMHPRGLGKLAR